ncbi:autotransporter domain-containing protein [Bradyrhizobium sp. SRS-191]|uniref:autotransporter domain-containing protein n=1 Tax=Bradyrhizobium sp. SRS-191 TaxID=2962606 RepID=UPI00211ED832|nr:autotransporter domain-containing protein [Bradyrhizobium sp. SRS-191]
MSLQMIAAPSRTHSVTGNRTRHSWRTAFLATTALIAISSSAHALDVASQADWNTAVAAVAAAGANSTVSINFTAGFTLTSSLSALVANASNVTVNITGNNNTVDGASTYQGIQVSGTNSPIVSISNLTINAMRARGGNGGSGGDGGGGGGLGAGGGLFVAAGANVIIDSVTFTNNAAVGGNGGVSGANSGGAGGGALNGGTGGTPPNGSGTGGPGGVGASSTLFPGGGGVAGTGGGNNISNGGTGGAGGTGGGGGGGGAATNTFDGGAGGAGGFGGGGGGGGFGGGSGGVAGVGGAAGYGAGAGGFGNNGPGSGGASYGGAVFVMDGATLTVKTSTSFSGNTTQAGTGGSPTAPKGQDLYINGATQIVTFQIDSGTTTFGGSTQTTQGNIAGEGGVTKTGVGTLALGGTNSYSGATSVNAGTLLVNGTLSNSATTVSSGATLGGIGTINSVTVASGGTLAPGSGVAGTTLAVQGSLAFASGAMYLVQVDPTTASKTTAAAATLGGASVTASFAAGTYAAKQYTILQTSGGVTGTFSGVTNTNLPAGFSTNLSYDANNVYLNLTLAFAQPSGSFNTNQANVANTIINYFNSNGSIPLVFGGLTPAGLSQLSGEAATGSQQTTFNAMTQFMGVMTDPFGAGRGEGVPPTGAPAFADEGSLANAYAATGRGRKGAEREAYAMVTKAPMADPFARRWSVWAAAFGGSQTTDGNAALGSNTTTSNLYGTAVGFDYRLSPNTVAGFAMAGGGTSFSVANALGSGRSDLFQAGGFVRHTIGPAYITAALAYGWQDVTTNRTVTVAGIDQLRAQFKANAWSGRLEGGYRVIWPAAGIGLTPYAAGQFTTYDLPAYAEQAVTGANTFALAYGARSATAPRSELGLRTDKAFAMPEGVLTLRGRFAWAHDYTTGRTLTPTFQTLPGASFVVNGAQQAADRALVSATAEMKWMSNWSAALTFDGEFASISRSYGGKGVVRYSW